MVVAASVAYFNTLANAVWTSTYRSFTGTIIRRPAGNNRYRLELVTASRMASALGEAQNYVLQGRPPSGENLKVVLSSVMGAVQ